MEKVLITGGAGFIGNEIINYLEGKYEIIIFDNFSEQIHGDDYQNSYLYKNMKSKVSKVIKGDVSKLSDLMNVLNDEIDYVIHLAAETGTGQSMYEINKYTQTNIMGTSNIFQIISEKKLQIKKITLASSRSVYGEGSYSCSNHGVVYPLERQVNNMKKGSFDLKCPVCSGELKVIPTDENSLLNPLSYYAYTKLAQEKMVEILSKTYEIPYTIFRYQNVYGAGQSLNNPYTGILSIFSKLLLANKEINIFEDGLESRDFVHVKDVARITSNSLENKATDNEIINVGSGERKSVLEVAYIMKKMYDSSSKITISGNFRKGDIRHNIADISKSSSLCDFNPEYSFEQGISEFTKWVKNELDSSSLSNDNYENSITEMEQKGIIYK